MRDSEYVLSLQKIKKSASHRVPPPTATMNSICGTSTDSMIKRTWTTKNCGCGISPARDAKTRGCSHSLKTTSKTANVPCCSQTVQLITGLNRTRRTSCSQTFFSAVPARETSRSTSSQDSDAKPVELLVVIVSFRQYPSGKNHEEIYHKILGHA